MILKSEVLQSSVAHLINKYIGICHKNISQEDLHSFLYFTALFIKNVPQKDESRDIIQDLFSIFKFFPGNLLDMIEVESIEVLLQIYEELILIGIPKHDLNLIDKIIMLNRLLRNCQIDDTKTVFSSLSQMYSLVTSCLLYELDNNLFSVNSYLVD